MPKLPHVSGATAVRALERLGFTKIRQSGSHVIMRRGSKGCVVPNAQRNQGRHSCGCSAPSRYIARRIHRCLVNLVSNPAVNTGTAHKAGDRPQMTGNRH
ncbi:MAG: type II toxin-antitoxin system HicA family toxin [Acidithiobacillus ferrivorans]